jgi:hypothetical protein
VRGTRPTKTATLQVNDRMLDCLHCLRCAAWEFIRRSCPRPLSLCHSCCRRVQNGIAHAKPSRHFGDASSSTQAMLAVLTTIASVTVSVLASTFSLIFLHPVTSRRHHCNQTAQNPLSEPVAAEGTGSGRVLYSYRDIIGAHVVSANLTQSGKFRLRDRP